MVWKAVNRNINPNPNKMTLTKFLSISAASVGFSLSWVKKRPWGILTSDRYSDKVLTIKTQSNGTIILTLPPALSLSVFHLVICSQKMQFLNEYFLWFFHDHQIWWSQFFLFRMIKTRHTWLREKKAGIMFKRLQFTLIVVVNTCRTYCLSQLFEHLASTKTAWVYFAHRAPYETKRNTTKCFFLSSHYHCYYFSLFEFALQSVNWWCWWVPPSLFTFT